MQKVDGFLPPRKKSTVFITNFSKYRQTSTKGRENYKKKIIIKGKLKFKVVMAKKTELQVSYPPSDVISSLSFAPESSQYLIASSWDGVIR